MKASERAARAMAAAFVDNELDNVEINPARYAEDNWQSYRILAEAAFDAIMKDEDFMHRAAEAIRQRADPSAGATYEDAVRAVIEEMAA